MYNKDRHNILCIERETKEGGNLKMEKKNMKSADGITLIALVITIIVLIILAMISISMTFGSGGLIERAEEASFKTEVSAVKEKYLLTNFTFTEDVDIYSQLPIRDQIIGYNWYSSNCEDTISMLQTAKGALDEDVSLLNRMIELLEYCNNGTIVEEDKEQILLELNALTEEIDRIAETVQFNGQYILNQDKTIKAYYGTKEYQEIYMEDFSSSTLNLNIDISSEASIQTSMTNVENALTKVGNKIKELETSNTFFENKNTELSEKAEALNSYTYLDNIELAQLQQDGELESDKIAEIDATLTSLETTINIIQTAEGSANEIHGKLQRMKELAVQGTNDTNNDDDRIAINNELNTLKNEIDEIVNNTNYGGTQLLDGTYHQEIVIGLDGESITLTIDNWNTDCLGENNTEIYIDVSSVENAEKTRLSVDEAIKKISNMRAKLGANQNRLQYTSNYYLNLKNVLNNKIENEETKSLRMALVGLEEMQSCFSRVRELMIQIQAPPNSE